MFQWLRLRKAHSLFLSACRTLKADDEYWKQAKKRRSFFEKISPVPLLGLHADGVPLYEGLQWLEQNASSKMLNSDIIRKYHRIVYRDRPNAAGEYRRHSIKMTENPLRVSPPEKIPNLMKLLDVQLGQEQKVYASSPPSEDATLRAAVALYHKLGAIHPFEDGNGRVARLAMNHLLRRYGLGYVIYPPLDENSPLWEILKRSRKDDLEELVEFSRTCLYRV